MDLFEIIHQNIVIFAHRDDDGIDRCWNITSLLADPRVKRHTIRKLAISLDVVQYALRQGGVERDHLRSLWGKEIDEPIIMADTHDGKYIIIDGNHRYVLRAANEKEWIYAKVLRKKIWEAHLITGITKAQMDHLVDQESTYLIDGEKMFGGA